MFIEDAFPLLLRGANINRSASLPLEKLHAQVILGFRYKIILHFGYFFAPFAKRHSNRIVKI